jgi:hypothetical protein
LASASTAKVIAAKQPALEFANVIARWKPAPATLAAKDADLREWYEISLAAAAAGAEDAKTAAWWGSHDNMRNQLKKQNKEADASNILAFLSHELALLEERIGRYQPLSKFFLGTVYDDLSGFYRRESELSLEDNKKRMLVMAEAMKNVATPVAALIDLYESVKKEIERVKRAGPKGF